MPIRFFSVCRFASPRNSPLCVDGRETDVRWIFRDHSFIMPSALFTPIQLRDLTLANRIAISPLCQYSAVEGTAQPWHWMHLGGFAVSGAGLVILEATAVSATGRISPKCLGLYSAANEAALTRLLTDVRRFSNIPMGIQLSHAGRKASTRPTWKLWKVTEFRRKKVDGARHHGRSALALARGGEAR
jgi:2,4-dienoyl-CoA reductase-like NADH-dependent reductase (Old Yellow Enzyme family)